MSKLEQTFFEMLKELESNFSILETKILKINKNFKSLSERYTELSDDYHQLMMKYEEEKKKNHELLEEQKKNKVNLSNIRKSRPQQIDEKPHQPTDKRGRCLYCPTSK